MPTTRKQIEPSPTSLSDSYLVAIPGYRAHTVWPVVEKWVDNVCRAGGGRYKPDDYYKAILERNMQLWLVWNRDCLQAFVITEIIDYPHKRYCNIHALGGRHHDDWIHLVGNIEEWAKMKGCDGMEAAHGRLGFKDALKELGWDSKTIYYEKEF